MSAPVKNTCPDIDKVIASLRAAVKSAQKGRKEYPDADDYFWDILYEIEGLEGRLDDLRKDNSSLRDWGHSLDEQLREAAQVISDLETQLEEKVNA